MTRLQARWHTSEGRMLAQRVVSAFAGADPLPVDDLGRINGRIDLRGFEFLPDEGAADGATRARARVGLDREVIVRGSLNSADLSGARIRGMRMEAVEVVDCEFARANLRAINIWGGSFEQCSFARADLASAALGSRFHGKPTTYSRCSFSHARLMNGHAIEAHFESIDFTRAKLDRFDFLGSTLTDCVFAGELVQVTIYGEPPSIALERGRNRTPNRLAGVDMTAAKFTYVDFRLLDLTNAALPESPDILVLRPHRDSLQKIVERALSTGTGEAETLVYVISESDLKWALPGNATGVLELSRLTKAQREIVAAALAASAGS